MTRTALAFVAMTFALGATTALAADATQIEINKKSVVEFYDKAINQKDFEAASTNGMF